jgi:hypothetical protein
VVFPEPIRRAPLAAVIVLALALGGCVTAGPSAAFGKAICRASDRLHAAEAEFAAAADGVALGDVDRVATGAAGMEREAQAATAALAGAGAWEPGRQLIAELEEAASGFARAATRFAAGARQGNGPALDAAVAAAQAAAAALSRADAEAARLGEAAALRAC